MDKGKKYSSSRVYTSSSKQTPSHLPPSVFKMVSQGNRSLVSFPQAAVSSNRQLSVCSSTLLYLMIPVDFFTWLRVAEGTISIQLYNVQPLPGTLPGRARTRGQYQYLHTSSCAASTFNSSTCFSNACSCRSTYSCGLCSNPPSSPHSNKNSTDRMPAQSLPTRQLGKDGPQVTAIGFGLMYVTHHA
jgi:hypothetical protein